MKMKNRYPTLLILMVFGLMPACREKDESSSETMAGTSPFDAFYTEEAPSGARQISETIADPVPGREIVLSGEVMGRTEPFVPGRGMVTLGDPTRITPCNRIEGDTCPTPWDNCCDDPEVLKKSVATIQFLDEGGRVMKSGLKGYRGIKELSFLTVKGTIAEGSNPNNLLINAEAFHVTDPSPYIDAEPVGKFRLEGTVTEDDGVFIYTREAKAE